MLLKKLYEFCVPFLAHKPQNDYICTCENLSCFDINGINT